jgi:hypothetical protein
VRTLPGIEAKVSDTTRLAATIRVSLPAGRFIDPDASKITITLFSAAAGSGVSMVVESKPAATTKDFQFIETSCLKNRPGGCRERYFRSSSGTPNSSWLK